MSIDDEPVYEKLERKVLSFGAVLAERRCIEETLEPDERAFATRILEQLANADCPNVSAIARDLGLAQPRLSERFGRLIVKLRRNLENDPDVRQWLEARGCIRPTS
jgi:hypothetical protein